VCEFQPLSLTCSSDVVQPDTVKTYLSPKRTPNEKSKRTPFKSQNVLPTKSKHTIDKVKTYYRQSQNVPPIVNQSRKLIDKWFVIDILTLASTCRNEKQFGA